MFSKAKKIENKFIKTGEQSFNEARRVFLLFSVSFLRNVLRAILLFLFYAVLIKTYGPDKHGLFTLAMTIANYVNIVESGVGASVILVLYKIVRDRNKKKINQVLKGATIFFRYVALIYFAICLACAFLFPLFILESGLNNPSYWTYFGAILIIISLNLPGYLYGSKYDFLLMADIKNHIINIINISTMFLTQFPIIIVLFFSQLGHHIPYLLTISIYVIWFWFHNFVLVLFCRYRYRWLNSKVSANFMFIRILRKAIFYRFITTCVFNFVPIALIFYSSLGVRSGFALYNQLALAITTFVTTLIGFVIPAFGFQYQERDSKNNFLYLKRIFYVVGFCAICISVIFYIIINPTLAFWYGTEYLIPNINLNFQLESLLFSVLVFFSILMAFVTEFLYLLGFFDKAVFSALTELFISVIVGTLLLTFLKNKVLASVITAIAATFVGYLMMSYFALKMLLKKLDLYFYKISLFYLFIFGIFIAFSYFALNNFAFFNNPYIVMSTSSWVVYILMTTLVTGISSLLIFLMINHKIFIYICKNLKENLFVKKSNNLKK